MDSSKVQFNIETSSGVWKVRKPMGRMGALHFSILSKCAPTGGKDEDGNAIITDEDIARQSKGFLEWSSQVLPNILLPGGPATYDTMSGEDQYALFFAMAEVVNVGEKLFRFVD